MACNILNGSLENFATVVYQTLIGHLICDNFLSTLLISIHNLPNSPYEVGTIIIILILQ